MVTVTADPQRFLADLGSKWAAIWKAIPKDEFNDRKEEVYLEELCGKSEPLGRPTPERIRAVAARYTLHSATSVDGFHMRRFGLISDLGLEALGSMYMAMEVHGFPPRQVSDVPVPLLGKPTGGYRPFGLCNSFYRMWGKIRRPYCDEWEGEHWRPYFVASAGKSPVDPVWRAALAAEEAVQTAGKTAASFLWDIKLFYEHFSHRRFVAKGKASGFKEQIMRVTIAQYRAPRSVTLDGMVCRGQAPRGGIIAGCSIATTHVKVYTLEECDAVVERHPDVEFDLFVDDWQGAAIGLHTQVHRALAGAAADLRDAIEGDLECKVAANKAAIVASTPGLAVDLRRSLETLAGDGRQVI